MEPEQAWICVKEQLRVEMSRAQFDTWVNAVEFVSFEDGVFELGVQNSYAAEWLQNRVAATARRMLSGLLATKVNVHFSVVDRSPAADEVPESSLQSEDSKSGSIDVDAYVQSLYDAIVSPERVVLVPAYLLRWVPYIGCEMFWLIVAFRQAYFLSTGQKVPGRSGARLRGEEIYRWAGISRATFWRMLQRPDLGWFLSRSALKEWGQDQNGHTRQEANRYQFLISMPLTPGDATALGEWLRAAGIQEDPIAALQQAIETPVGEILPYPAPAPKPEYLSLEARPVSVQDVVRQAAGKIERETMQMVARLSEALAVRLIPTTDNLQFTWYFLQKWLPFLGPQVSLFIALLRSKCYYNRETGELRNTVWIDGGYETIATALKLKVPTIYQWLPPVFTPTVQATHPLAASKRRSTEDQLRKRIRMFLERTDHRRSQNRNEWQFQVSMHEPFVPEDQGLYMLLVTIIGTCEDDQDLYDLALWINKIDDTNTDLPEPYPQPVQTAIREYSRLVGGWTNETLIKKQDRQDGTNETLEQNPSFQDGTDETLEQISSNPHRTDKTLNQADVNPGRIFVEKGVSPALTGFEPDPVIQNGDAIQHWTDETPLNGSGWTLETLDQAQSGQVIRSKFSNWTFETLKDRLDWTDETLVPGANWTVETLLKGGLKTLRKVLKDSISTTTIQDPAQTGNGRWGEGIHSWDLGHLLEHNRVGKKKAELLLRQETSPLPFLSWLIYGARETAIVNPISLAISKLSEQPGQGAGGVYDRLVELPAEKLVRLIERTLNLQSPYGEEWTSVMGSTPVSRIRSLAEQLDLDISRSPNETLF